MISFDWHQDLISPNESKKQELENLDLKNLGEVAYFSWARLNPNNDSHILAGAYLNLYNDIWIVCKQGDYWEDESFLDYRGNQHVVRKFKSYTELYRRIIKEQIDSVLLDIDIDYFTIENNTLNDKQYFTYISKDEIITLVSSKNELMKWVFNRLYGITIALEPECTGGLAKSLELFSIIESVWFNDSVGKMNIKWNHLIGS